MGCFLGCLRNKDDGKRRCQFFSKSLSWMKKDLWVPMNRYASVASSNEKSCSSEKMEREIFQGSFTGDEGVLRDLRQEAKLLKDCGAILGTPVEIRKASEQHSVFSDEFCKKLNWDQQQDFCSELPSQVPERIPSQEEPRSFQHEHDDKSSNIVAFEENKHSGSKAGLNTSALEVSPPQNENQRQHLDFESPYPTPLFLVDGMQTPGTLYPSKVENSRIGKIRTQFAFPVPDLSKSSFKLKAVCEDSELIHSDVLTERHMSTNTIEDRKSTQEMPILSNKEISWWLKAQSTKDETKITIDVGNQPPKSDCSPNVDKPITGAASSFWNEEELCGALPKQWDGNGIPNTTTKYKEDQKVNWHTTPFEARLEKALFGEKGYSHRKID
ncbi:hypothetical protein HPP92_011659 [Vanilla planifolia]|uniref:Protein JASON n=1 Tax=Vanilla planifolia TaxID=51239 RepID=A0A835QW37_VANPL|nr:hypothetical protein HPP92_011659 [Vanilla planifolia]